MAKCDRKSWPTLFAYLEAYGLDQDIIDRIDRIKGNASSAYYVVGWPSRTEGMVEMLDISNTPDRSKIGMKPGSEELGWNMLNDGMSPITEKDWNRIKIDEYCETFIIPDHAEYGY